MRLVMFKLGDESPPQEISGLLNEFERSLVAARKAGRKVLLIVDEAQNCETILLESIRLLLNVAQPGGQVLQFVLAGQIGLEEKLSQPELRQFRQRIRVAYRLECLNRSEVEAYIGHRLHIAGRESPLFEPAALDRIFALSGGVPRLVNQYASRALLAGFVENARRIKLEHVDEECTEVAFAPHSTAIPEHDTAPVEAAREQPRGSGPAIGSDGADFGERRPRQRGRRYLVAAIVVIAVVAGGATFRDWAPKRGVLPASQGSDPAHGTSPVQSAPVQTAPVQTAPVPEWTEATLVEAETDTAAASFSDSTTIAAVTPSDSIATKSGDSAPIATPPVAISAPVAVAADGGAEVVNVGVSAPTSVHVFSFVTPARAEDSRAKLAGMGVPAFVTQEKGAGERMWYRVYIGPYENRAKAQASVDSLHASGDIEYVSFTHKAPQEP
jgi:cell division septation protein DedD